MGKCEDGDGDRDANESDSSLTEMDSEELEGMQA